MGKGGDFQVKQVQVCVDLGTKATFFGLGLLASKKMRPYAKYFIIGGLALSAAPVIVQLVEKSKQKRGEPEQQVDEVIVMEDNGTCCCQEQQVDGEEACCEEKEECTEEKECECCVSECDSEEEECETPSGV